jgi:hypothetical protein
LTIFAAIGVFLLSSFDDTQDVVLPQDQVILAVEFDLGTPVLREEHRIAGFDVEREYFSVLALPGPTATTFPCCGFSFAVSGMMIPPLLRSSSASLLTMLRS